MAGRNAPAHLELARPVGPSQRQTGQAVPFPRHSLWAQLGPFGVLRASMFPPVPLLGSPSPGSCWSSALPAPGEPEPVRALHLLQAACTSPADHSRPALEGARAAHTRTPSRLTRLGTSEARCPPPSGQLWCIVVALHVLVVPVQCFHSASQRPAWPSRDFLPCLGRGRCRHCWIPRHGRPGREEGQGVHS